MFLPDLPFLGVDSMPSEPFSIPFELKLGCRWFHTCLVGASTFDRDRVMTRTGAKGHEPLPTGSSEAKPRTRPNRFGSIPGSISFQKAF